MTCPRTHGPGSHPRDAFTHDALARVTEGQECLVYARAVVADATHHPDDTVRLACITIAHHPDTGAPERARARDMQKLVEGELTQNA